MNFSTSPESRPPIPIDDAPAFARRGKDLEFFLERLEIRVRRERDDMLDMVRLRLRQWSRAVSGPDRWQDCFAAPIDGLWDLAGAEPPEWGKDLAPPRRRKAIARDLSASVERFNRRWRKFVGGIDLSPFNDRIDHYNRYYLLEKECVVGSSRLASRHFVARGRLTVEGLLGDHPLLPPVEVLA